MITGFPTSCVTGVPEDLIDYLSSNVTSGAVAVTFSPNVTGWFTIIVDRYVNPISQYVAAGATSTFNAPLTARSRARHQISVAFLGDWQDYPDAVIQQQLAQNLTRITLDITAVPSIQLLGSTGSGALDDWELAGLRRFTNVDRSTRKTYGTLEVSVAQGSDGYVVTLATKDGRTIAQGTTESDGPLTLTGDYGVSGSVNFAYTGDLTAQLLIRWPAAIKIHYKTTPFVAGNFPRTAEKTLYDDGGRNDYAFSSGDLAAGTWYAVAHQVDENGNESTGLDGGGETFDIVAVPASVGVPRYVSGDETDTVVAVELSDDGAAYWVFDSLTTGEMSNDPQQIITSPTVDSADCLIQLADLSGSDPSFTGERYVWVQAVLGGINDQAVDVLTLRYVDGQYVRPLPPTPDVSSPTTDGLALTVKATVVKLSSDGIPATVELFLFLDGTEPNWTTPDAVAVLDENVTTQNKSVTAMAPYAGLWQYACRTRTEESSAGSVQSDNDDRYGPVLLSTVPPSDPIIEED